MARNAVLDHLGLVDLCLLAGAGAGKTRLLIEAYFCALELVGKQDANPYERVVAITFTNEAATEIRKRVIKHLLESEGFIDPERLLQANTIGTIHSFCNALLREFGHLVRVNPLSEIPPEFDISDLQQQVTEEVATEMLDGRVPGAEELFGLYSLEGWAFAPGLMNWVHQAYTRARWQLLEPDSAGQAIKDAWKELVAFALIEDASERRKRISSELGVPEKLADFVGQFIGKHMPVVNAFGQFVIRYWKRLDKQKALMGWLSQDDTLYHAARLLELPNVKEVLRNRFRFLLIDEYQDTDPLQHRVVEALRRTGFIFRVGDPKQSIYRFRSARPSIFIGVVNDAARNAGLKQLSQNRRAVPELRDFWNQVFTYVFDADKGKLPYTPLDGAESFYSKLPHDGPPVEIFRLPAGNDGTRGFRDTEAAWIAGRIRELVGNADIYDIQRQQWRRAGFRDVALLFRVKTHIEAYLEALIALGIPFVFVGGKDFFAQSEIRLIITALYWIAYPTAPFYVAAVLRSALFAVKDKTLLRLAPKKFRIDPSLCDEIGAEDADEGRKLTDFLSLRRRLLMLSEGPTCRVLEELLVATGFGEAVLAQPEGLQKFGNLRHFVALAREYDTNPGGSLADLCDELERAATEEQEEPEALVADEGSDAVRIMTVHAAKGLEFPIVFVPQMFRRQRPIPRDFILDIRDDGRLTFFLAPRIPSDLDNSKQKVLREAASRLADRAFRNEEMEVDAEERRLLYVAFTRARERLIFSLPEFQDNAERKPEGKSWSNLLEQILGTAIVPNAELGRVPGGSARFRVVRNVEETTRQPLLIDHLSEFPEQPVELLAPPTFSRILPSISAGGIADYRYCPYRYYLGRELGVHGAPGLRVLDDDGSDAARGTLVHLALQYCDFSTGNIPAAILNRAGDDREWIVSLVTGFRNSNEGEEVALLPADNIHRELRFRTALEKSSGTRLVGVVDLAYKTDLGWKIIDYKTGRVRAEERELHVDQAQVYAAALRHIHGFDVLEVIVAYLAQPEETWTRVTPQPSNLSLEEITSIAIRCAQSIFPARPSPTRCSVCPFGGRHGLCREGRKSIGNKL